MTEAEILARVDRIRNAGYFESPRKRLNWLLDEPTFHATSRRCPIWKQTTGVRGIPAKAHHGRQTGAHVR